MSKRTIWLIPLALAAWGCDGDGPPEQEGELGLGTFTYICRDYDAECGEGDQPATEPGKLPVVARGGHFAISFSAGDRLRLDGRRLTWALDEEGETTSWIQAAENGWVALLGEVQLDVYDFIHVKIEEPTAIRIGSVGAGGALEGSFGDISVSAVGGALVYRAVPVSAEDLVLAGGFPFRWTVADESVVRPAGATDENDVTLEVVGVGSTTLTVELGELSRTIPVEVGGGS